MSKKVFLVDVNRCNGCFNCQIACKDEHCGQAWLPYAEAEPEVGQFWCRVDQETHGTFPKVNVTYLPRLDAQDAAIAQYAPEVLMERDDDLIVIEPEKAKGRKDLAEKFSGVFWNEELEIPQGCTGCAHLIDDGWSVPRCVDACAVGGLRFGDADDLAEELERAEKLTPTSNVYYLNLPKRWIAGQLVDPVEKEVIIGAKIELVDDSGVVLSTVTTDEFGDFWFKQINEGEYNVHILTTGYAEISITANVIDSDAHLGTIELARA